MLVTLMCCFLIILAKESKVSTCESLRKYNENAFLNIASSDYLLFRSLQNSLDKKKVISQEYCKGHLKQRLKLSSWLIEVDIKRNRYILSNEINVENKFRQTTNSLLLCGESDRCFFLHLHFYQEKKKKKMAKFLRYEKKGDKLNRKEI